jgi:hypothetical protein
MFDEVVCPECGDEDFVLIAESTNKCLSCGAIFDDFEDDFFEDDSLERMQNKYERNSRYSDWDDE